MPVSNLTFPGNYYAPYGKIVVIKRNGQDSASFELLDGSYVFGRADSCDIRIQLPAVAEEHCRIHWDGRQPQLQCLCTTGVVVASADGVRVTLPVGASHPLGHLDLVTIVERTFRYEVVPNMRLSDEEEQVKRKNNALSSPSRFQVTDLHQIPQRTPIVPKGAATVPTSSFVASPLTMPAERTLLSPSPLKQPATRITNPTTPTKSSTLCGFTESPVKSRSSQPFVESPIKTNQAVPSSPGRGMTAVFDETLMSTPQASKTPQRNIDSSPAIQAKTTPKKEATPSKPSTPSRRKTPAKDSSLGSKAPIKDLSSQRTPVKEQSTAAPAKDATFTSLQLGTASRKGEGASRTPDRTPSNVMESPLKLVIRTPKSAPKLRPELEKTPVEQLEENYRPGSNLEHGAHFTPQPLDLGSGIVGAALHVDHEIVASPRLSPRVKLVDPVTGIHYSPMSPPSSLSSQQRQQLLDLLTNNPDLIKQSVTTPLGTLSSATVVVQADTLGDECSDVSSPSKRMPHLPMSKDEEERPLTDISDDKENSYQKAMDIDRSFEFDEIEKRAREEGEGDNQVAEPLSTQVEVDSNSTMMLMDLDVPLPQAQSSNSADANMMIVESLIIDQDPSNTAILEGGEVETADQEEVIGSAKGFDDTLHQEFVVLEMADVPLEQGADGPKVELLEGGDCSEMGEGMNCTAQDESPAIATIEVVEEPSTVSIKTESMERERKPAIETDEPKSSPRRSGRIHKSLAPTSSLATPVKLMHGASPKTTAGMVAKTASTPLKVESITLDKRVTTPFSPKPATPIVQSLPRSQIVKEVQSPALLEKQIHIEASSYIAEPHAEEQAHVEASMQEGSIQEEMNGVDEQSVQEEVQPAHNLRRSSRPRTTLTPNPAPLTARASTARQNMAKKVASKEEGEEPQEDNSPLLRRGRTAKPRKGEHEELETAEAEDKENAKVHKRSRAMTATSKRSALSEAEMTPQAKRSRAPMATLQSAKK